MTIWKPETNRLRGRAKISWCEKVMEDLRKMNVRQLEDLNEKHNRMDQNYKRIKKIPATMLM